MIRSALVCVFLLAAAASTVAQPDSGPKPLRVRALDMLHEALRSQGSYAILSRLVKHAPKRLSGSPGGAAAVEWAHQEMTTLGLENIRLEEVTVPRWVRGEICDIRAAAGGAEHVLAACALGGSVGTPKGGLEARVIEVKSFGQLRALREKAKGAIIFFNRPFDVTLRNTFMGYSRAVNQRSSGAVEAAKVGGIAAIVRSVTSAPDDAPHTGAMRYDDGIEKVPTAAISVVAANRLAALLARHGGEVSVRFRQDCATLPPVKSANVVGDIVGREKPEEIVLIGAHLDGWDLAQGAQDDGAGVSHCLEAARLILKSGRKPRRTVRVVLYANEENGLGGGRAYAAQHASELENHVLAIETDAGAGPPRSFGVSGGQKLVDALEHVSGLLRRYDLGQVVQGGGGADISTLRPAGVPLMGLRPADHRYFDVHHSAKDTIDRVHPRELALGAAALGMVALAVADAEKGLPRSPAR